MSAFHTVRSIPGIGRIMLSGATLFVAWNKNAMKEKFPKMTWEFTHWSDIDLLSEEMIYANKGKYFALRTSMFKEACSAVPTSEYRH